jgi:DnaJ-class molecular chaperone
MASKQPRPKARCESCGAVSIYTEHINRRCVAVLNPGEDEPIRCEGKFHGEVDPKAWAECPACRATGTHDSEICSRCGGAGWLHRQRVAAHT